MNGKIINARKLGEFLVVVGKEGYRLLDMDTFTLSSYSFADEKEMTTTLDIISIRAYKGRE